jgi:hypothetical protein
MVESITTALAVSCLPTTKSSKAVSLPPHLFPATRCRHHRTCFQYEAIPPCDTSTVKRRTALEVAGNRGMMTAPLEEVLCLLRMPLVLQAPRRHGAGPRIFAQRQPPVAVCRCWRGLSRLTALQGPHCGPPLAQCYARMRPLLLFLLYALCVTTTKRSSTETRGSRKETLCQKTFISDRTTQRVLHTYPIFYWTRPVRQLSPALLLK